VFARSSRSLNLLANFNQIRRALSGATRAAIPKLEADFKS
jgi:hypothetical protein